MLAKLEELEQKYNFQYPSLYKELCKDGMLDWGQSSPNWYAEQYPKLKENPPLLLYGKDIEFTNINDVDEIYEFMQDPDFPGYDSKLRFIPFLQNGAGDHICFWINSPDCKEIPVIFVPHDAYNFDVQAKNLQDYIFREMLMAVVDIWEDSLIDDDFEKNIEKMFKTHHKYLTENQKAIVKEIYVRELKEYTYQISEKRSDEAIGLLTYDEFEKIIKQEIDFPLLGKKVPLYDE